VGDSPDCDSTATVRRRNTPTRCSIVFSAEGAEFLLTHRPE